MTKEEGRISSLVICNPVNKLLTFSIIDKLYF
jgi:hypothetical protein